MKKTFLLLFFAFITACGNPSVEYDPQSSNSPEHILTLFSDATGITVTNASAAGTELASNVSRTYFDFSQYSMVMAQFSSSLASSTVNCRIEYSINNGTSWNTLVSNFAAAAVANSHNNSPWTAIPNSGQAGVLLRALIIGDGVLDPIIRYVRLSYY